MPNDPGIYCHWDAESAEINPYLNVSDRWQRMATEITWNPSHR